jgi:hypothetical protein
MTPQLLAQMSLLMQAAARPGMHHQASTATDQHSLLPLLQVQQSGEYRHHRRHHHHHQAMAGATAGPPPPPPAVARGPAIQLLPSEASGAHSEHAGSNASTPAGTGATGAVCSSAWGTCTSAASSSSSVAVAEPSGLPSVQATSPRLHVAPRGGAPALPSAARSRGTAGVAASGCAAPVARAPAALAQQAAQQQAARSCTQQVTVSRAQMSTLASHLSAVQEASGAAVKPAAQAPNTFSVELTGSSQEVRAAHEMIAGALERSQAVAPRVA